MHKKLVKEDVFAPQEIDTIIFDGNTADIIITQSNTNDFKISQYSMKKIEKSMQYQTKLSNGILNIKDTSAQVDWFMGIKGSAGISYELQIPLDKTIALKLNMSKGNVQLANGTFRSINAAIDKRGNIALTNIAFEHASELYTQNGNIDVKFSSGSNHYVVNAIATNGNKNIDRNYMQGDCELNIQSENGNITVK